MAPSSPRRFILLTCGIVLVSQISSNGQAALRRPISVDNPLIIANTSLRMLTPGTSTGGYNVELHDVWNAIPDDMKPYCALNGDPKAKIPTEDTVEAWIAACQSIGAPCMLQAQQCNMRIYDPDGSIGDRLMKKYPNFLGYQWCEFQWAPVNIPYENVAVLQAHIAAMARNGGYLLMADMAGSVWNSIGANASLVSTMRQYKDNVIVLDKMTSDGKYYWNQSAVMGFWLAGMASNYGVSPDNWIWQNSGQGDHLTGPAAIQALMIEKSAALGATVFLKFEVMNSTDLNMVHYPLLRKIIKRRMTPTLAEVKSQIKVGLQFSGYPGYLSESDLCAGLYFNNIWMPSTGRYGIVPVFPQQSTGAETNFCELVTYGQFSTIGARQTFYNQRYPDNGITGTTWVAPFPDKGYSMFANPNETNQSSRTSTFTLPLLRNSCQSLSGTLPSYTYGTVEEAPDSIGILVGNYLGASTLARSNVTTFVLKGLTETKEPGLTISGQTSYTKSWNAATQEYTLAVTHNGTVSITLWTSGGSKPATMIHSPQTMGFKADSGTAPFTQNVTLTNTGAGTLGAVTVRRIAYGTAASSWLSTQVLGTGNNQQVSVQATPGSLHPGTYTASVVIEAAGTKPDSLVCPVSLAITRAGAGAINAGGPAVGLFDADKYVTGGSTFSTASAVSTAGVAHASAVEIYQSERFGAMVYTLPGCTPGASYTLRLHFAELYWTASGQRLFNVRVNGIQALTSFDIFAAAGGAFKAVVQDVSTTATSAGQIVVEFSNVTDNAKLSALEWFPARATVLRAATTPLAAANLLSAHLDRQRRLQIEVNQSGAHTVRVAMPSGATVVAFSGTGAHTYALDARSIPRGTYIVSATAQGRTQSMRVVVGR